MKNPYHVGLWRFLWYNIKEDTNQALDGVRKSSSYPQDQDQDQLAKHMITFHFVFKLDLNLKTVN